MAINATVGTTFVNDNWLIHRRIISVIRVSLRGFIFPLILKRVKAFKIFEPRKIEYSKIKGVGENFLL